MMKAKLWLVMLLCSVTSVAQDEHLKMRFDFENASGTSVTDDVSCITAKTAGVAKVVEMGSRHVLDPGNASGYLNMTTAAGKLVRQLEDFTISVYYCVARDASLSGAGYFLWAFSQSAANTETSGPYTAYRLNTQRIATSAAGWGSEVGMEVGTESAKGRWVHVLYRQTGTKGELFLDGKRVQQTTGMPVLKNTFKTNPANCWIGRAPFSGDSYLTRTLVADFRLYDIAVTDAEVRTPARDDGHLTLGIQEPADGTTWLVWDNFTLTYQGPAPDGIRQIENGKLSDGKSSDAECFDLSGRRVAASSLAKGIYIVGGRKVAVK